MNSAMPSFMNSSTVWPPSVGLSKKGAVQGSVVPRPGVMQRPIAEIKVLNLLLKLLYASAQQTGHFSEQAFSEQTFPEQNTAMAMTPDHFKTDMISLLPRLRRFAFSLTRSHPDAEDLLQDACAAALQKWHQYDPAQPMDRWMFRVVRNLWINEIRKRKVRQGEGQVSAEDAIELSVDSNQDEVMTAKQVRGKVNDLHQDLAQPLMLVCAEGYSYREASDLLGVPIGTVMSRIHRARKQLVSSLSDGEFLAE